MREHDYGVFMRSAPMVDEILTDDRIQGVNGTRIGAVLSAPLTFKAGGTSRKAAKIKDEIAGVNDEPGLWDRMFPYSTAADQLKWGINLGFAYGQIGWERTTERWLPRIIPWHPQFVRWDWQSRRFIAQTERGFVVLPRPDEQPRGDGQWFVYCPYGVEYGWRSALIRSICQKYLSRQWIERDFDRWCERQGLGFLKGIVPQGSQPAERDEFFEQLNNVGSEGAALCIRGPDGKGYDIEISEFEAQTFLGIEKRRSQLDSDIAIAILGQNLTTEVKGGSFAATQTQNLVRLDYALRDAKMALALRDQLLSWYCEYNYGDPDLAPTPKYEVEPPDDDVGEATALKTLGEGLTALKAAEPRTDVTAIVQTFGIPLISEEELAALEQEEEDAALEAAQERTARGLPPPGDGSGGGTGGDQGGGGPAPGGQGGAPPAGGKKQAALSALDVRQRYVFAGLPIAVENPAGSIRLWQDGETKGSTKMGVDYGFIEGHLSSDGEEIDCYVGPFEAASEVFVIHQLRAPDFRAHDEDKLMLGFASADDAKACFLAHRSDGERAYGSMSSIPLDRFIAKLNRRGASTNKIHAAVDYMAPGVRALAARRTVTGRNRSARYQETLIANAKVKAARALGPDIAALRKQIDAATSLSDLRSRVLKAFRGMDPDRLAKLVQKTTLLAKLNGRFSAIDQL